MGEYGILNALYNAGIIFNDVNPDYVVVGEPSGYSLERITKAIRLVEQGAKLIGTNYDMTGSAESGIESDVDTVLVLSGVTSREDCLKCPYRPGRILDGVGEIAAA